jgi:hypothetical protein
VLLALLLQEVLGELLVEEASAYVLGQEEADLKLNQVRGTAAAVTIHMQGQASVCGLAAAELTPLGCVQAVRGAVVKRLEWLDSNFLAALNAFLSLPGVRSNPDLMALLGAVRTETLQLVRREQGCWVCGSACWCCFLA